MRLIDADALKKSIDEHVYLVNHGFNETEYGCTQYGIHQIIDEAQTIDAELVRHGVWIETEENHGFDNEFRNKALSCSVCRVAFRISDYAQIEDFRYCPNCGARMDK